MAVCNPRRPGESPSAETGHKAAQARHQPGNSAAAAEVFRSSPVEAHYVKADHDHQQAVNSDYGIINQICALHASHCFLILSFVADWKLITNKNNH